MYSFDYTCDYSNTHSSDQTHLGFHRVGRPSWCLSTPRQTPLLRSSVLLVDPCMFRLMSIRRAKKTVVLGTHVVDDTMIIVLASNRTACVQLREKCPECFPQRKGFGCAPIVAHGLFFRSKRLQRSSITFAGGICEVPFWEI